MSKHKLTVTPQVDEMVARVCEEIETEIRKIDEKLVESVRGASIHLDIAIGMFGLALTGLNVYWIGKVEVKLMWWDEVHTFEAKGGDAQHCKALLTEMARILIMQKQDEMEGDL